MPPAPQAARDSRESGTVRAAVHEGGTQPGSSSMHAQTACLRVSVRHSYLPVFNIWALFKASSESGIGVGGVPRDTSYGLYRDGTQLRGIFTSRAQVSPSPSSVRAAEPGRMPLNFAEN